MNRCDNCNGDFEKPLYEDDKDFQGYKCCPLCGSRNFKPLIEQKDEIISAFAFKTGKAIEKFIKDENNHLDNINSMLEAKIHQWYFKTKDEEFAKHFNLTKNRNNE